MNAIDRWMTAPVPFWVVLVAAAAGIAALLLVLFVFHVELFHHEEDEDPEDAYARGRADEREHALPVVRRLRHELEWWQRHSPVHWREQMEQLSQADLDSETAALDLPGPVGPRPTVGTAGRTGELHDDPGWCIACGDDTHYLDECPMRPSGLSLLPSDPVERQLMLGWGLRRQWEADGWALLDEMAAA